LMIAVAAWIAKQERLRISAPPDFRTRSCWIKPSEGKRNEKRETRGQAEGSRRSRQSSGTPVRGKIVAGDRSCLSVGATTARRLCDVAKGEHLPKW
jgi:hypothetical protein